jgi:hypothetical protein
MTFRVSDEQGRQIVQVRFWGQTSRRGYTYAVDPALGELKEKDWVWTPGNKINLFGTFAGVTKIGSDYSGEMSVITQKLSKDPGPQTITVERWISPNSRAEKYGDR